MTSANVTEYRIFDKSGKQVGEHRQHMLCKTHWEKLLEFKPVEEHTIQAHGFDVNEVPWEGPSVNLRLFLLDKPGGIPRTPTDPPGETVILGRKVPYCCDGEVKKVSVYEAHAYRHAISQPVLVGTHYTCAKCKRILPVLDE